jgi:hypothetical protein
MNDARVLDLAWTSANRPPFPIKQEFTLTSGLPRALVSSFPLEAPAYHSRFRLTAIMQFVASPAEMPRTALVDRRGTRLRRDMIDEREETLPDANEDHSRSSSPYFSTHDSFRNSQVRPPSGYFPPTPVPAPQGPHLDTSRSDPQENAQEERRDSETTLREDDLGDSLHLYNPFAGTRRVKNDAQSGDDLPQKEKTHADEKSASKIAFDIPHVECDRTKKPRVKRHQNTLPPGTDSEDESDDDEHEEKGDHQPKKRTTIEFNPCGQCHESVP